MTERKYVLGVSAYFHDSAAALVSGETILAAAQEERFSRVKGDWRFPEKAIQFCLSHLPPGAQLEKIAFYEDPKLKARRILETAQSNLPSGARLWPRMIETLKTLTDDLPQLLCAIAGDPSKVCFVPHHLSHAASAFYPSPFASAAVLVIDGVGEEATTSVWSGSKDGLTLIDRICFPHSLGLFYSAFTQYCGFKVNSGEYKLMGLAPFGVPQFQELILNNLISLSADSAFSLNMDYFDFHRELSTVSPKFEMLFGQSCRAENAPITLFHMNIAASAQAVLEMAILALAQTALNKVGSGNLCLAGGVALNCVANSRLVRELSGLTNLWVQPSAGDAGGALGAALHVALDLERVGRTARESDQMSGGFLGPGFSDAEICDALQKAGLKFHQIDDPALLCDLVADSLGRGEIVGHFDGRMEFGPRALGNRSILADPRGKETLGRVNKSIKFREDWRPFAPMVLADAAQTYFEEPTTSPYMLLVAILRPEFRGPQTIADARALGMHTPMQLQGAVTSAFAAVTHVDFSARLQTVDPKGPERCGKILAAFFEKTGCPMLLNTSFNVRGEPIICSPQDAIDCFLNTHIDVLAIGSFLVRKSEQAAWVRDKIGKLHFASD